MMTWMTDEELKERIDAVEELLALLEEEARVCWGIDLRELADESDG